MLKIWQKNLSSSWRNCIFCDSNPICLSNIDTAKVIAPNYCGIEPSILTLSCIVNYHGNEAPIMQWNRDGNGNGNAIGKLTQESKENRVIYNLSVNGDITMNNSYYTCNTTRSAPKNYGCNSSKIMIEGKKYLPSVKSNTSMLDLDTVCQYCKVSDTTSVPCSPVSDCKGYSNAIFCIIFVVVPIAIGGAIAFTWYCLRVCKNRKRTKNAKCPEEGESKPLKGSEMLEKENKELKNRNEQLKEILESLKKHRFQNFTQYINDWIPNTKTIKMIDTTKRKAITGIAVLEKELFIVKDGSPEIEVYGTDSFTKVRDFQIKSMKNPLDVASSEVSKCLYIINRPIGVEANCQILRTAPKSGKLMKYWSVDGDQGRLSTYGSHVIVCLFAKQVINEYTKEGDVVNTVSLQLSSLGNSIHPFHAIKISHIHFVITRVNDEDEKKTRKICAVDLDGTALKDFRIETQLKTNMSPNIGLHEQLYIPICLAEDNGGYILIAGGDQNGILVFNSALDYLERLEVSDGHSSESERPTRLCLDESKNQLFVAVNNIANGSWMDGRVLVFNRKERESKKPNSE